MTNTARKMIEPITGPRILTFTEACTYLGVKKATLYNWIGADKIPAFKVDGSRVWKFDRADLDAWIEKQKVGGSNDY